MKFESLSYTESMVRDNIGRWRYSGWNWTILWRAANQRCQPCQSCLWIKRSLTRNQAECFIHVLNIIHEVALRTRSSNDASVVAFGDTEKILCGFFLFLDIFGFGGWFKRRLAIIFTFSDPQSVNLIWHLTENNTTFPDLLAANNWAPIHRRMFSNDHLCQTNPRSFVFEWNKLKILFGSFSDVVANAWYVIVKYIVTCF